MTFIGLQSRASRAEEGSATSALKLIADKSDIARLPIWANSGNRQSIQRGRAIGTVRMNLRATYDRDFPGSAAGRRHIECFGSPMTGRFCLWCLNSRRGCRISVGRRSVVIRIGPVSWVGDNHYSMVFPTVMAKGVVAKMAAGYRTTAMPDGECAGDLTCTEDQSQNQNRSCLATH